MKATHDIDSKVKTALQRMAAVHMPTLLVERHRKNPPRESNRALRPDLDGDLAKIESRWLSFLERMADAATATSRKRRDQRIAACILICRLRGQSCRQIARTLCEKGADISRDRVKRFLDAALERGAKGYHADLFRDECADKKRGPSNSLRDGLLGHLGAAACGKHKSSPCLPWAGWPAHELAFFCLSGYYPPNQMRGGGARLRKAASACFTSEWYRRENKELSALKCLTKEGERQWVEFKGKWAKMEWPEPRSETFSTCEVSVRRVLNANGYHWIYPPSKSKVKIGAKTRRMWLKKPKSGRVTRKAGEEQGKSLTGGG